MEIIAVVVGLLALAVFYSESSRRSALERLRRATRERWGKIPDREYTWQEYDRISHYFRRKKDSRGFYIDDITWNDLDMDEVFRRINQTWSSVGEETLYYFLRTPEFDPEKLKERQELIQYLADSPKEREELSLQFAKLGRAKNVALSDYLFRFAELSPFRSGGHILQALIFIIAIGLVFVSPEWFLLAAFAVGMYNIYTYYKKKPQVECYFVCIGYLLAMAEAGKKIGELCGGAAANLGKKAAESASSIWGIRRTAGAIKYRDGFSGSLADLIMDYVRMLFHIDLIAFERVRRFAAEHTKEVEALYESLGELEACVAVASFRESLDGWCLPELELGNGLWYSAENIYHPLLDSPVKNSISEKGSVLLTGSNASGKSTFLKTVAINGIFAQTIATCLADRYRSCFFRVYSSMALRDDIRSAESYYIVEIRALKRILDAAAEGGTPVLCFVDEVLRGTNTVERIAASSQILKSLPGKRVLCFAATHDIELTHLLGQYYHNYHFEEEIHEQDISFPYRLLPGRAVTRNAIRLLGLMGYEGKIISEAEAMAERFARTGEWSF